MAEFGPQEAATQGADIKRAGAPGERLSMLTPNERRAHSQGYSVFVGMAKVVLPIVALIVVGLIIAWPHVKDATGTFNLGFSAVTLEDGEEPSMVNVRYVGSDQDQQAYSITADMARNIDASAQSVELDGPKADITLEDQSWLVLTANHGTFHRLQKTLELIGSVNLYHDSGYEMRTGRATVNLELGSAVSEQPVEAQGPFGQLLAQGLRLDNKGEVVHFTGKSHLVIYPGQEAKP